MPYDLPIPKEYSDAGWKAKIREKERLEPPHVTIMNRTQKWRFNLRSEAFMDDAPPPKDVPGEVLKAVKEKLVTLREEWDKKYPSNPVGKIDG